MYGPHLPQESEFARSNPFSENRVLLTGHSGPVLAVRFNQNGNYCLSCGKDRTLRLWNPHKGTHIKTYVGHGYDVRDVAVTDNNSQLASCGGDKQVFNWDVASGRIIRKFAGHDGVINSVCYGSDGSVIVTGGYDKAVKVWDCRSRSFHPVQSMAPFRDSVTRAIARAAEILACSVDGTVRRFDVRMGALYTDELHVPVTHLALSNDGNCVLANCMDSTLRLLDKESGELLASYRGHVHESIKLDCALTPSDEFVVGGSEDGNVFVWDLVEETVVQKLAAHAGAVCSLAVHPEGGRLLTASTDGAVAVW
mmetsp:Transcript_7266/g.17453  ORF Transcript_7266/g.17453 Transcript_7266/m.17453 type:complete len:309 (+) Transcript_7266:170-1096(+)